MSTPSTGTPPNASFLGLPAEIRNDIYAYLFEHNEPIVLLGRKSTDISSPMFYPHTVPGISLLGVSSDIRREALGVLYSRNTFLVTARQDICNDGYHLIQLGAWLSSLLPSTTALLRNVQIDMGPICDRTCTNAPLGFEVGYMMKLLWRFEEPSRKVSFVYTGRQIGPAVHPFGGHTFGAHITMPMGIPAGLPWGLPRPGQVKSVPGLNRMLAVVNTANVPQLRTYLRCSRTLKSVWSTIDGLCICFYFGTRDSIDNVNEAPSICFDISNDGHVNRRVPPPATFSSLTTKPKLWNQLFDLLISPNEKFIYHLDKQTTSEPFPKILSMNRRMRTLGIKRFSEKQLHAKITDSKIKSTFHNFHHLKNWSSNARPIDFNLHRTHHPNSVFVDLAFAPTTAAKYEDLRFSGLDFIMATSMLSQDVRVELHLLNTGEIAMEGRDNHFSLGGLRDKIFEFLAALMQGNIHRCSSALPTVWVDGNGRAREAEFMLVGGGVETVVNQDYDGDDEDMQVDLYQIKEKLRDNSGVEDDGDDDDELEDGDWERQNLLDWTSTLGYVIRGDNLT